MVYIKQINGINYYYNVEEVLNFQIEPLLRLIEKLPIEQIKNRLKIEMGFSVFELEENEDGYTIVASDYETSPFSEKTADLTLACLIQIEQTEILQKYGIDGEKIRFFDEIAVAKGAISKPHICLQRFKDLGGSGWCINEIIMENDRYALADASEYETIFAYQLLELRPSILRVLLLPYDYMIIINEDEILEILDQNDKSVIIE